ncbi:MAG: hypothetical protein FJW63_05325 [Actinobacteria bacterium]|nr:hypothetical protein [Actinomycetota bacterium]
MKKEIILEIFQKDTSKKYFVYPNSFLSDKRNLTYFIVKNSNNKYLGIAGDKEGMNNLTFLNPASEDINLGDGKNIIRLYCMDDSNLEKIKVIFPFLLPTPIGLSSSFGFGDRLGIATPAHIRVIGNNRNISPVFAQQSVRELEKTGRDYREVIDDVIWGVFQEGFEGKWGADADHLKNEEQLRKSVKEGFTMYTLDPSDLIQEQALYIRTNIIKNKHDFDSLYFRKVKKRYVGKKYKIGNYTLKFNEDRAIRIAIVYKKALDFILSMYRILKENLYLFDLEISFDETNIITSPEAHFFIANEMQESGVEFDSLALRFPGIFEKGIDYKGDVLEFSESVNIHRCISKKIGCYKLSLHSGSDKFSIYPAFARYTESLFHIKTSGTTWLEAMRVIAICNEELFRELYQIAIGRFEENRKDYKISLDCSVLPKTLFDIKNEELPKLIDRRETRQLFHISYGSFLEKRRKEIYETIFKNEEKYYELVANCLGRHLSLLEISE